MAEAAHHCNNEAEVIQHTAVVFSLPLWTIVSHKPRVKQARHAFYSGLRGHLWCLHAVVFSCVTTEHLNAKNDCDLIGFCTLDAFIFYIGILSQPIRLEK